MARKSQGYRLQWPVTPLQWEHVDEMLQSLFDDTNNGKLKIKASQITVGVLGVPHGGTGISEYVIGDILYASATDELSTLADVATGNALISGGVGAAPSWGKIDLTTHVSGVLPVANGGTDISSYAVGDLLYASAATTLSKLADVSAGSYLRSGGVTTAPVWSTVKIPNTATTGDLWHGSATNTLSALASVAVGSYLRSAGVGTANVWSTVKIPNAATTGDLWQGTSTSNITALASVAAGSYLRSAGVATANVWSTLTLPNASVQGDLFYSTAANAMIALAKDANATRYLSNTGTSNDPAWAQVNLANGVTGDLLYANLTPATIASILLGRGSAAGGGDWEEITLGTGLTMTGTVLSASGGSNHALLDGSVHTDTVAQTVTRGSLVYGDSTPAWNELVIGAAARVLRSDGTDVAWAQVALTTDVTGTLPVANGGTGIATLTANRIPYGNGTSAFQSSANLTFDGTTFTLTATGPHSLGGGINAEQSIRIGGTFTPAATGAGITLFARQTIVAQVGQNVYGVAMQADITEPASGVAALYASMLFLSYSTTPGAGTVTAGTNLYMDGEPNNAVTNYAMFIDAGKSRMDGTIESVGVYNNTTASGAADMQVASTGLFYRFTSSRRFKTAIAPITLTEARRVLSLTPVSFVSQAARELANNDRTRYTGLIAEDVATVMPELVIFNDEIAELPAQDPTGRNPNHVEWQKTGRVVADGVAYDRLPVHMLLLLKDMETRLQALEAAGSRP